MTDIVINPGLAAAVERSPEVKLACAEKARQGAEFARSIAPVGGAGEGDYDPGKYRDSFRVEELPEGARIVSDVVDERGVPTAALLEVGSIHNPPFHVLAKTGEALGSL